MIELKSNEFPPAWLSRGWRWDCRPAPIIRILSSEPSVAASSGRAAALHRGCHCVHGRLVLLGGAVGAVGVPLSRTRASDVPLRRPHRWFAGQDHMDVAGRQSSASPATTTRGEIRCFFSSIMSCAPRVQPAARSSGSETSRADVHSQKGVHFNDINVCHFLGP